MTLLFDTPRLSPSQPDPVQGNRPLLPRFAATQPLYAPGQDRFEILQSSSKPMPQSLEPVPVSHPLYFGQVATQPSSNSTTANPPTRNDYEMTALGKMLYPLAKVIGRAYFEMKNPGPQDLPTSPFAEYVLSIVDGLVGKRAKSLNEIVSNLIRETDAISVVSQFLWQYGDAVERNFLGILEQKTPVVRKEMLAVVEQDPLAVFPYAFQNDENFQRLFEVGDRKQKLLELERKILEETNPVLLPLVLFTELQRFLRNNIGSNSITYQIQLATLQGRLASDITRVGQAFSDLVNEPSKFLENLRKSTSPTLRELMPQIYLEMSDTSSPLLDIVFARSIVGVIETGFVGMAKIMQTLSSDAGFKEEIQKLTTPQFAKTFVDAITELRSDCTEVRTMEEIQEVIDHDYGLFTPVPGQQPQSRIKIVERLGSGTVASAFSARVEDPELLAYLKPHYYLSNYHRMEVAPRVIARLLQDSETQSLLNDNNIPAIPFVYELCRVMIFGLSGVLPEDEAQRKIAMDDLTRAMTDYMYAMNPQQLADHPFRGWPTHKAIATLVERLATQANGQFEDERQSRVVVKILKEGISRRRMDDEVKLMRALNQLGQYFQEYERDIEKKEYMDEILRMAYIGWRREVDFAHELAGAIKLARHQKTAWGEPKYRMPNIFVSNAFKAANQNRNLPSNAITIPTDVKKPMNNADSNVNHILWELSPGVSMDKLMGIMSRYHELIDQLGPEEGHKAYQAEYAEIIDEHPFMGEPSAWIKQLPDAFLRAQFEQLYMQPDVHGDPHPGNIFVGFDGRQLQIFYIDTGLTIHMDGDRMSKNLVRTGNIVFANPKHYAREAMLFWVVPEDVRKDQSRTRQMAKDLEDAMQKEIFDKPYSKRNTNFIAYQFTEILKRYNITPPSEDVLLIKSQLDTINIYDRLRQLAGIPSNEKIILTYTGLGIGRSLTANPKSIGSVGHLVTEPLTHYEQSGASLAVYAMNETQIDTMFKWFFRPKHKQRGQPM